VRATPHKEHKELEKELAAAKRQVKVSIPPTKVGGFTASQPTAFTEG
jgi:hypothetical protein